MELDEALRGRRSIRNYKGEAVPMDMVQQVLEAGTLAPSAHNGQQWRFSVLTGKAKKRVTDVFRTDLSALSKKGGSIGSGFESCRIMEQAPVVIIVWNAGRAGFETHIHSVAAAIENMLLKAYALGLGTLWIGDVFEASEGLIQYFGKHWELTAAIALGWPAENPNPRPRKSVSEVAEFLD